MMTGLALRVLDDAIIGGAALRAGDTIVVRPDSVNTVVFVRDLKTQDGDIVFDPQSPVSIGVAAWDGSAGDRNGQKSVTIWHRLVLDSK